LEISGRFKACIVWTGGPRRPRQPVVAELVDLLAGAHIIATSLDEPGDDPVPSASCS